MAPACEDAHPTLVGSAVDARVRSRACRSVLTFVMPEYPETLSNGARACHVPRPPVRGSGSLVQVNKECRGKRWERFAHAGDRGSRSFRSRSLFVSFLAFFHLDII